MPTSSLGPRRRAGRENRTRYRSRLVNGFRIFSIGNIPVYVSPWYLLLLFIWSARDAASGLIWAFAITSGLLIHEFGHALVARHYRLSPSILLTGLGGLTFHAQASRDRHDALITAAGPAAGLLVGALVWGVSLFVLPTSPRMAQLIQALLVVNIGWSLLNLLPLWPLDGGQLFRLGLLQILKPPLADKITHVVSLVLLTIAAVLILSFVRGDILLLTILVAFGIWQNVQALRGQISSGVVRRVNTAAKQLLVQAKQAQAAGDFREAARLCHLLKGEPNIPDGTAREMWAVLGIASARIGDYEEAIRALERAPETAEVVEAKIEALHQLDRMDELEELLASSAFRKLPSSRRAEILAVIQSEANSG